MIAEFFGNLWELSLDAGPWLLFGLLAAGVIKAVAGGELIGKLFGGKGLGAIVRAAAIGAPLPLCSCGVLPAAIGLRRSGASKGATVSFLVSTPETGVDSIAISYAMLGPFMMVVRPVAAVVSAVVAGVMAAWVGDRETDNRGEPAGGGNLGQHDPVRIEGEADHCCGDRCGCEDGADDCCGENGDEKKGMVGKVAGGCWYALTDLLDDIALWLVVGLVLAALVMTFVEPGAIVEMARWGGGLPAMVLMILVGVPMYICATASTPVAAAMLIAGVSPGTVLVFLLAGPATNVATLGMVKKEMGGKVLSAYLVGICISAIGLGLLTDLIAEQSGIDVVGQMVEGTEVVPHWLAVVCVVVLLGFGVRKIIVKVFHQR